jgi:hypothetical protein
LEVAALFPEDRVVRVAYSSPTSFFHDKGTWDEEKEMITINLENKILIFLDQPHNQLLERLRPLLSHDQKELVYKITDKREKLGLRTKNVRIIGYPAVIFCTGRLALDEQEATRMILLSPEISQEKLREAVYLKILKEADERAFREYVDRDPRRKALRARIKRISELKVAEIIVPEPEKVFQRFIGSRRVLKPRHARDAGRLMALIKVLALLNYMHRRVERSGEWITIYASEKDVEAAFQLYGQVAEPQEYNLSPFVLQVFRQVIEPLAREKSITDIVQGPTRVEIMKRFLEVFGRPLSRTVWEKEIVPALEAAGLLERETHPQDRRRTIYIPTTIRGAEDESTPPCGDTYSSGDKNEEFEKYVPQQGGVNQAEHQNLRSLEECREPQRNVSREGGVSYNDRSDQQLISLLAQPQPKSDQPFDQNDQCEKQALQAVESRNSTPHPSDQLTTGVERETQHPVTPGPTEEPPLEYSGPVCSDCVHWHALKCEKHPDWIVVTPTARYPRNCEYFTPKKEVKDRAG